MSFHCTVRRTGKEGARIYEFFYDCTLMVVCRPITIDLVDEKKLMCGCVGGLGLLTVSERNGSEV